MYFIEIPFSRMGENCPLTVQPAFIIPAVLHVRRMRNYSWGRKGRILCIFIFRNIFQHPPALQHSSLPAPALQQSSSYLHLLPVIYDCSPRGIHSAKTDCKEWKISHFRGKYFQHGRQQKTFKVRLHVTLPVWYGCDIRMLGTTNPYLMFDRVCGVCSFVIIKAFMCFILVVKFWR